MTPFVIAILALAASNASAQDWPTPPQSGTRTFYDASGRISGTATTEDRVTTYRDAMGRITGTAERLPDGRIEFRDGA